jgi:hypothetical protein
VVKKAKPTTILSADRRYRYTLWREWETSNPAFVQFIGLNPSTADETQDDATVRRCMAFAKAWGFGALCMTNLFAYRSKNPKELKSCRDAVGPENDDYLKLTAASAAIIVAAWGTHGTLRNRNQEIMVRIPNLNCLGVTKHGHPRHPLRLPSGSRFHPLASIGNQCQIFPLCGRASLHTIPAI